MLIARFFIVFGLISSISLPKLSAQIYHITDNYRHVKDTVKQFGKGDTLSIEYDSVYVLNHTQMHYYELLINLKADISKDNSNLDVLFKKLLQSMTKDLAELAVLTDHLKANADSTSKIGEHLINETLVNVQKANNALDSAKVKLDSAQFKLAKADSLLLETKKLIENEKKQRFWRNLKWAGVGAVAGFVVKAVFFRQR